MGDAAAPFPLTADLAVVIAACSGRLGCSHCLTDSHVGGLVTSVMSCRAVEVWQCCGCCKADDKPLLSQAVHRQAQTTMGN